MAAEFLLVRQTGANARINQWSRPFDTLVAIEGAGALSTGPLRPAWRAEFFDILLVDNLFRLPKGPNDSALAMSGVDGLVQVHGTATAVAGDAEARDRLLHPDQRGRVVYVTAPPGDPSRPDGTASPDGDTRIAVPVAVEAFSANELRVRVDGAPAGSWLYYADSWHPEWRATVDGAPVPVRRANVAYKAVELSGGSDEVVLRFGFWWFPWWIAFMGLHALAVVAAAGLSVLRLSTGYDTRAVGSRDTME